MKEIAIIGAVVIGLFILFMFIRSEEDKELYRKYLNEQQRQGELHRRKLKLIKKKDSCEKTTQGAIDSWSNEFQINRIDKELYDSKNKQKNLLRKLKNSEFLSDSLPVVLIILVTVYCAVLVCI